MSSTTDPDWRALERPRAYQQVIDQIEEQILAGRLQVGDKLPSERDLAGILGVSRSAVREAMRALEAIGVVSAGVGRDGGTVLTSSSSQALRQWLRLHVLLANIAMPDVIEARVMSERWSASLAAVHASDAARAELTELVEAMEEPEVEREVFNDLDTAFHVAIAEAGDNRLVAELTASIRSAMAGPILDSFRTVESWQELLVGLRAGHRRILEAILARDAARAADEVEEHIREAFGLLEWRSQRGPSGSQGDGGAVA